MNRCYPVTDLIPKLNEGIFFLSKGKGGFVYQQACWFIDHHELLVFKKDLKHEKGI
jgi:hypothetical protein